MAQKIVSKKNVKKTFFEVSAPLTSTKIQLYASTKEELEGKIIRIDLTKNLRGKSLELKMRVKLSDDTLYAVPESLKLLSSYCKKVMRRGSDYVEDSFQTEYKDALLTIKPFLVTRKRTSREVLNIIRQETKKDIESYVKTRTTKELFSDIIANKLQKQLAMKLKKIYPLALCEIRVFEIHKTS